MNLTQLKIKGINCYIREGRVSPSIIMIHGAGGSARHWEPAQSLLPPEKSLLAFDIYGHGESENVVPPTISAASKMINLIKHERKINAPIDLIAHSIGGLIALYFALENPEQVNRLILISSAASMSIHQQLLEQMKTNIWDIPFLMASFSEQTEQSIKQLIISNMLNIRLAKNFEDFMAVSKTNLNQEIHRLQHKTLVIIGGEDNVISPRRSRDLAKTIPNASFSVIPKVGHYPHLEDPTTTYELIREFLI